jgi:hypothetical protein
MSKAVDRVKVAEFILFWFFCIRHGIFSFLSLINEVMFSFLCDSSHADEHKFFKKKAVNQRGL